MITVCTLENPLNSPVCDACGTPQSVSKLPLSAIVPLSSFASTATAESLRSDTHWICSVCGFENRSQSQSCGMCSAPHITTSTTSTTTTAPPPATVSSSASTNTDMAHRLAIESAKAASAVAEVERL